MVMVSPRGMCESWKRHRASGYPDPTDKTAPGRSLRIKVDGGHYVTKWFRYDRQMELSFYRSLHPEDVKKLRPLQIPQNQSHKKARSRRK